MADILLKDEIFLSAPTTFNDPFDRPVINFSGSDEKWNAMLNQQLSLARTKKGKPIPPAKKIQLKAQAKRKNKSKVFAEHFNSQAQNSFCVLCLSSKPDNLLMWSHYADSHKGICVGFGLDELQSNFELIFRINYLKEFPKVSLLDIDDPLKFLSAFSTKHPDWSYEEEIRVANLHTPRLVQIPANTIKSIHLGCEITAKEKDFILDLSTSRELNVEVFQAEKDIHNLKLHFKNIN